MANGDSDAVFGGNGSVKWIIDVEKAKQSKCFGGLKASGGHRQEGQNHTTRDGKFTITIKCPQEGKAAFLDELIAAAQAAKGGTEVTFQLQIEDDHATGGNPVEDQIRISWSSDPNSIVAPVTFTEPPTRT